MSGTSGKSSAGNSGLVFADGNSERADSGPVNNASGLTIIDPADIDGSAGDGNSDGRNTGDNAGEPVRKRRGRPAGSARTARAKKATLDINGVEGILLSAHTLLAAIAKTPELILDKDEAKQLAEGIANVSRHYDLETTQKGMDWGNLIMVVGMIYGTRIFAIRAKKASSKKPDVPQTMASNVVDIPGVGKIDAAKFGSI